jgi:demethylmenaquinone methyltransferase / 2-methoxy-6-polyprenyl-1,4-benzoquinol methylase
MHIPKKLNLIEHISIVGYILHGDPNTYRYIPESLKLYPGQIGVREMMNRLGFVQTGFHEFGGGITAINYGTKPKMTLQLTEISK